VRGEGFAKRVREKKVSWDPRLLPQKTFPAIAGGKDMTAEGIVPREKECGKTKEKKKL